jgi:hypothetical protein
MNTVARDGLSTVGYVRDIYPNADKYMAVFGEPDVRIHMYKQLTEYGRKLDEVVTTLATSYIKTLVSIFDASSLVVRYILPPRSYSMFGIYVPRGTLQERVMYTRLLNNALKNACTCYGVLFLENTTLDILTTSDGELRDEFCDGLTHYNTCAIPHLDMELARDGI